MCGKILTVVFILIALGLAISGSVLPPEHIDAVIMISKFFDIMLPVLAVGALIKYLCKCSTTCACCNGTKCSTTKCSTTTNVEGDRSI